jgi:hypothetical protein
MHERARDYPHAADHYHAYLGLNPAGEDAVRIRRKIESLKQRIAKGG